MITLCPFTEKDFDTLISWVHSKEELFQFAGAIFNFPLTHEQLHNYINTVDKKPYKVILNATNETIGHCELNYENEGHRLSRILIGVKTLRGQHLGEHIVTKMVSLFFEDSKVNEVELNVYDWNEPAIKCYTRVGFKVNPKKKDSIKVNGKTWIKLNMILKRKVFLLIRDNTTNFIMNDHSKQSALTFYRHLEMQFPEVAALDLLHDIDIFDEPWKHSGIMISLAEVLTHIVVNENFGNAKRFMDIIENAFDTAEKVIQSYIITDFLVTIMEQKKQPREYIKSIMGIQSKHHYTAL